MVVQAARSPGQWVSAQPLSSWGTGTPWPGHTCLLKITAAVPPFLPQVGLPGLGVPEVWLGSWMGLLVLQDKAKQDEAGGRVGGWPDCRAPRCTVQCVWSGSGAGLGQGGESWLPLCNARSLPFPLTRATGDMVAGGRLLPLVHQSWRIRLDSGG